MAEPLIRVENLEHVYPAAGGIAALCGVSLTVDQGEYVAIVGANGSGKSTLVKHLNALLLPTRGDVWINGWNTRDPSHIRDVRQTVGMVFQDPDNQIVATVVEEDVAFGPENLGVAESELPERVRWALETTGLSEQAKRASGLLSAGQKQRLAIAGALAMKPQCLVLDEAAAMLDPAGKAQLLDTVRRLNQAGATIISVTHDMSDAAEADRVVVLVEGQVLADGVPSNVFADAAMLQSAGLDLPPVSQLAHLIATRLEGFPIGALTVDALADAVAQRFGGSK